MYIVKFDLHKEPTDLKQISKWPLGFGIILLGLTIFIFYLEEYLPIELFPFYIAEIVGEFVLHLITLSVIFISTGIVLKRLGWRKGQLTFLEDRILIKGSKDFYLKYDGITQVKLLNNKTLQIRTRYYPVRIRFRDLKHLEETSLLIENKKNGVIQLNGI